MVDEVPVTNLIERVLNDTGYMAELENENTPQSKNRIENLKEFMSYSKEFDEKEEDKTLANFLASVSLVSDIDEAEIEDESITLMTLHSAKGLEFPVVFLVGMEENIFPISRATDFDKENELEEERRLCYVGITRAKERLFLSNARVRTIYGDDHINKPSRFLYEIPQELIKTVKRQSRPTALENFKQATEKRSNWSSNFNPRSFMPVGKYPAGAGTSDRFKTGDRVSHSKWGSGMVVSVKERTTGRRLRLPLPVPVCAAC